MPEPLQVVIVYNKSNTFGLAKDAQLLVDALPKVIRSLGYKFGSIQTMDAHESPIPCSICIHLEIPYAVWFSWAKTNCILVNSEWWLESKWSSYINQFTVCMLRKGTHTPPSFLAEPHVVSWCSSLRTIPVKLPAERSKSFVWFLGGSPNKRAAAEALLPLWKESYPPLTIYVLEPLSFVPTTKNISIQVGSLTPEQRSSYAVKALGHICASKAESFGYTAAEAEELGAFTILNTLPCYIASYMSDTDQPGVHWLPSPTDVNGFADFSNTAQLQAELDIAMNTFESFMQSHCLFSSQRQACSLQRASKFLENLSHVVKTCMEIVEYEVLPPMPPVLQQEHCPPISIITLAHNRPKFMENACLNLLHSDYPRDKIEWIVVDDSDPAESASNRVIQFEEKFAPGTITYIPLTRQRSIGYKRNLGVERAKHSILLMMDDDDHYPTTSFRRRVAYLLKGRKQYECAVCTTIAMYDLQKGISAVNAPPFTLSLAERCSEATLTFTKTFWNAKKFPDVSMAEGEGFLEGRESQVVEMPPQQMIVALSHGTNLSSRKIPDTTPGCFWGFPRPLLEFLHGLVGVKVEEEEETKPIKLKV